MPHTNLAYANKVRAHRPAYSPRFEKFLASDTLDSWYIRRYCDYDKPNEVSTIRLTDPQDNLLHDWPRRLASVDSHREWLDFYDVSYEVSADLYDEWPHYLDTEAPSFSPISASVDPVTAVSDVIAEAAWILSSHTWDDDGNAQYQQATMDRAHDFLLSLMRKARYDLHRNVPLPVINPAGAGSVDIFWDLEGRQLLVNISADSSEPISFYGEDGYGTVVSGVSRLSSESDEVAELRRLEHLVTWLSSE